MLTRIVHFCREFSVFSLLCFDYTPISDICTHECHPLMASRVEYQQDLCIIEKSKTVLTALNSATTYIRLCVFYVFCGRKIEKRQSKKRRIYLFCCVYT